MPEKKSKTEMSKSLGIQEENYRYERADKMVSKTKGNWNNETTVLSTD